MQVACKLTNLFRRVLEQSLHATVDASLTHFAISVDMQFPNDFFFNLNKPFKTL